MHNLIKFIDNNKNWKDLLKAEPYNLMIVKSEEFENLYLFKYNQIKSDFSEPIVRESRGIIIEVDFKYGNSKAVCVPFDKFFNYGDPRADDIDLQSIKVQEKIDGSIIKLYYYQSMWRIATNGTINAFNTPMPHNEELFFGKSVLRALNRQFSAPTFCGAMDRNCTYIFEFVSKWNKIVVSYGEIDDIYHIGTRDNRTGEELLIDIGIKKPKNYPLQTLEEIVETANALPVNEEGYVVVDKDFRRVKVKGLKYLAAHRLKGASGIVDLKKILDIVQMNETAEFLIYFPEYTKDFERVQHLFDTMKLYVSNLQKYKGFVQLGLTRKEIALMIQREVHKPFQQFAYKILDGAELTYEKVSIDQLKQYFEI